MDLWLFAEVQFKFSQLEKRNSYSMDLYFECICLYLNVIVDRKIYEK